MNNKIYILHNEDFSIVLTFTLEVIAKKLKSHIEKILDENLTLRTTLLDPNLNLIKDLHERDTLKN